MKKVFLFVAAMLLSGFTTLCSAQITSHSSNDANIDGTVDIADVNNVLNEMFGAATTIKQVVSADDINTRLKSIEDRLAVIEKKLGIEPAADSNLLPGKFSVSATKQVQFTKGNLYWDGSAFKLEDNQVESSTGTNSATWNASHVSHFYWTSLTDYQSGNASYMPYAENYSYSSQSTSDKFWCGEDNPLSVEGTSGLYALTSGDSGEWYYLINSRTNASSLYKYGVTVMNNGTSYNNCLIIAPDDFTGTLQSSYTLDEVNNLGLVCLPAAGYREGSSLNSGGSYGNCWSATPHSSSSLGAYNLYFSSSNIFPADYGKRSYGRSLRLVCGF